MLVVDCKGSPYEIGFQHGSAAKAHIARCLTFYASLFLQNCKQTWPQVVSHASHFCTTTQSKWPAYYEEMRGIADGAGVALLDIVALNVRTEINFGLFNDGCTSLSWHTKTRAYLAQNWDWMSAQKENLIVLKISQVGKPTIQMVTEAGIIGKIGMNSEGVGTLLNAIRIPGMDPSRLPVHFGLRMALECYTAAEAVEALEKWGMAASAHILVADAKTAVGLEFTKETFARCLPDELGRVVHSNHMLLDHAGQKDTVWLKDTLDRLKTMTVISEKLSTNSREPSFEEVSRLFENEENYPAAICREETKETGSATLFNIVMDLKRRRVVVKLGKPVSVEETLTLMFPGSVL